MSDIQKDAKRGRLGYLLVMMTIALGSGLILFPAWIPNSSREIGEDSAVELLQLGLLAISAALFFAAAPHAGRLRPIYQALGIGGVAAALGEYAGPLEQLIKPVKVDWLLVPVFAVIAWLMLRNLKEFSRFWGLASRRPASGFLLAGVIITYVFGEIFGSKSFWQASLGDAYHPDTPKIVESYLELLACYFIFVSTIGFTIPVTRRERERSKE